MTTNPPKTISEHVESCALQGYATFPTRNKIPVREGVDWRTSEVDSFPVDVSYPYGEYAIVLTKEDLVVDIDPRNFPIGRKVWSEFKEEFRVPSYIDKSKVVRTPSGGLHIYLKKPEHLRIRKNHPKFPGLDFLSAGCYVLGPGSRINGKEYAVVSDAEPLPAPAELLLAITRTATTAVLHGEEGWRDTADNKERFREYLVNNAPLAVEGQAGDVTTFKVACRGRDYNLSPAACFELMAKHYNPRCAPPWSPEDLQTKVGNAYKYNDAPAGVRDPAVVLPTIDAPEDMKWLALLDVKKEGEYRNTLKNCVLFLRNDKRIKAKFRYNEFTYKLEIMGKVPWESMRINAYRVINDLEITHISLYLANTYGVEFNLEKLWQAVAVIANEHPFHPVRTYIDSLEWDGVPRLDTWLADYCGAQENDYSRVVGRKTLIGAVARAYEPGIKFDHVLILEGPQGIGKSTVCKIIGGEWFGDAHLDFGNPKDTIDYIHSHWVIELSEMESTRRADISRLKAFLTRTVDDARPAYARTRVTFPRQCIFIGTVNPEETGYLVEDSAYRRFWPVYCTRVDFEGLKAARDQLLAEARQKFRLGEKLMLDPAMSIVANDEAKKRAVVDPWYQVIREWLDAHPEIHEVTTAMIYTQAIGGAQMQFNTSHARRIANALRESQFTKIIGGTRIVWRRMSYTPTES